MKHLLVGILLFASACNLPDDKAIEGIYVGHFEHEYGINDDTLVLKKTNQKNMFELTRKTGTIRKLDDKVFPKEWHSEVWTLDYNPEKQTFFELRHGKILIWNKTENTIQIGNTKYRKLSGL